MVAYPRRLRSPTPFRGNCAFSFLLFAFSTAGSAHSLIGAIASVNRAESVAVFMLEPTAPDQEAIFLKEGARLSENWYVKEILFNKVTVCRDMGEDCESYRPGENAIETYSFTEEAGFKKEDSLITVSRTLKDELISKELAKILMQAASRPVYKQSSNTLLGIELLAIDSGSLYDAFGLQDGDIITQLDDVSITNFADTIRQLKALQNADLFQFTIIRNGIEQKFTVEIRD